MADATLALLECLHAVCTTDKKLQPQPQPQLQTAATPTASASSAHPVRNQIYVRSGMIIKKKETFHKFMQEFAALKQVCDVPYVSQLIFANAMDLELAFPYYGIDLTSLINLRVPSDFEKLNIIGAVILALSHLHALSFVHMDVKCENIMYLNGLCTLIDFEFMEYDGAQCEALRGSLPYVDPHFIASHVTSSSCDVFSFGIVVAALYTRRLPWEVVFDTDYQRFARIPSPYCDEYSSFFGVAKGSMEDLLLRSTVVIDPKERKQSSAIYEIIANTIKQHALSSKSSTSGSKKS